VTELETRLAEDRALRDAALRLFKSDIALIRGDLDERGLGARAKDRLGGAALEVLDEAVDYAESHRGWVAAGAAAIVLWFARKPILGWLADQLDAGETADGNAEPGETAVRSGRKALFNGDTQ
jgi:hypothetical protein